MASAGEDETPRQTPNWTERCFLCSTSPVVWGTLLRETLQPTRRRQPSIAAFWRQSSITRWPYVPCCHFCSVPASTPCCTHCKYCNQTPQKTTLEWSFSWPSRRCVVLWNEVSLFLLLFRISQRLRVLGSLVVIMAVFIVTAVIVRLPFQPLPFFCVTMVKIVIINGACSPFLVLPGRSRRRKGRCDIGSCFVVGSLWGCAAGKRLWDGRVASCFVHDSDHERSGTGREFCCLRHDLRHCKCVASSWSHRCAFLIPSSRGFSDTLFYSLLRWFRSSWCSIWLFYHSLLGYISLHSFLYSSAQAGNARTRTHTRTWSDRLVVLLNISFGFRSFSSFIRTQAQDKAQRRRTPWIWWRQVDRRLRFLSCKQKRLFTWSVATWHSFPPGRQEEAAHQMKQQKISMVTIIKKVRPM